MEEEDIEIEVGNENQSILIIIYQYTQILLFLKPHSVYSPNLLII